MIYNDEMPDWKIGHSFFIVAYDFVAVVGLLYPKICLYISAFFSNFIGNARELDGIR